MKRIVKSLAFLTAFVLPSMSFAGIALAFSGTGSGTSGDPYKIATCSQLEEVNANLAAHYMLVGPIDCTGVTFTPLGNLNGAFTGTFDGNGFPIENITVSVGVNTYAGLFGRVSGGSISDVTIESSHITNTTSQGVGAIAGAIDTNATVSGIQAIGNTLSGNSAVGGLVGSVDTATISSSSVSGGTVEGAAANPDSAINIGGAVGQSTGATISKVSVQGTTVQGNSTGSASDGTGGFVGRSHGDTINDSYSTATVTGDAKVGGFVGSSASTGFSRDYAAGSVTGNTDVGGFSGYEGLNGIDDSFTTATVTGTTHVGGLIGNVQGIGGDAADAFFDVTRTGTSTCVGQDNGISVQTTCTGVNTASAQPNYFFNTTTNAPFNTWNFTTTWHENQTATPTLISVAQRPNNTKVTRNVTALTVSWAYPADDGGSAITSYDFGYRLYGSNDPFTIVSGLSTSTLSQKVSGLASGTQYEFAVRANNAIGHGVWALFFTNTLGSASTANAKAPDTGYGTPQHTYIPDALSVFAGISLLSGFFILRTYRKAVR